MMFIFLQKRSTCKSWALSSFSKLAIIKNLVYAKYFKRVFLYTILVPKFTKEGCRP